MKVAASPQSINRAMPEGRRIEVRSLKSDISPHIVISSEARNLSCRPINDACVKAGMRCLK